MASLSEVMNALVAAIAPSKPGAHIVHYYPGKPFPEDLDSHMTSNRQQVTVFPYNVSRRVAKFLVGDPQVVSSAGGSSVLITEKSRQIQWFQIDVWANDWGARDTIGEALKLALDSLDFLTFADGSEGRVKWVQTLEDDDNQEFNIYHRKYLYEVEYPTVLTETVPNACLPRILNDAEQVVAEGSETSVLVDELSD